MLEAGEGVGIEADESALEEGGNGLDDNSGNNVELMDKGEHGKEEGVGNDD